MAFKDVLYCMTLLEERLFSKLPLISTTLMWGTSQRFIQGLLSFHCKCGPDGLSQPTFGISYISKEVVKQRLVKDSYRFRNNSTYLVSTVARSSLVRWAEAHISSVRKRRCCIDHTYTMNYDHCLSPIFLRSSGRPLCSTLTETTETTFEE